MGKHVFDILYIKHNINHTTQLVNMYNFSCLNVECQWVKIVQDKQRNIVLGNVYRPPQGNIKNFVDYLEGVFEQVNLDHEDLILMGDLNIDFLEKTSNDYKQIESLLRQVGMEIHIKEPTHYSHQKNSCLDQIISNSNFIEHSGVTDFNISDHLMVFIIRKKIKEKTNFKGRSYRNYDIETFQDRLQQHNWGNLVAETCPNKIWAELIEVIEMYINEQCPLKEFRISRVKEPWITPELLEFIKDKDKALKKAKRTRLPEDWVLARRLRNECLARVRNCKAEFIKNELTSNQDDSKKFWNSIKTVIPDTKANRNKLYIIDNVTNQNVTPEKLPDFVNNFFADIGPNLASNINGNWEYNGITSDIQLHDIVVNEMEILRTCNEINVNKSSSIKNVSSRIIKDAFLCIPDVVLHLIQVAFDIGIFPDEWKIANVTPLQKGGDKTSVTNQRPVSLLPLPSKIIERILHDRIMFHLERNNLLEINQGGFRKKHSTMDTISKFTNDIFNGLNNREMTTAVFIDLAKAFDTVNHEILLKKLKYIGIKGNLLKLLKNYLCNRKQTTTVNSNISGYRDITCGVPQGSILGPLLFLMYVNDLSSVLRYCKYQLYADDTVIYHTNHDVNISKENLEKDLKKFIIWCNGNALTVNIKNQNTLDKEAL